MAQAKSGDRVRVHYTGSVGEQVFDSSSEREPLEFTLGQGEVVQGFENRITGMAEGETKSFTVPADEAYGPRREDLILKVNREDIPDEVALEIGKVLKVTNEDGRQAHLLVTDINPEDVTLDGNHPLAGEELQFEVELVDIVQ